MSKPIKVLMVVMDFWQAGAERFVYEVDLALDKSKFEIHFLSWRDLNVSKQYEDYYYQKHIALGGKVHFVNNILGSGNLLSKIIIGLISNKVIAKILPTSVRSKILTVLNNEGKKKKKFSAFLDQFDVVGWAGEYTFSFLCQFLEDRIYNKSVIHLMNAKFQGISVYNNYPKNKRYIFTSGFDDTEQLKYELSDFKDFTHVLFPLFLNINVKENNWKFKNKKKKIGIFTRLDSMKPLDPFMYAFHLLLHKLPDAELHIFGSGDPVQSGVKRYTAHLGIEDNVFFRGHSEDIVKSAVDEELDLVWYQGYKNRPGGYAGFDICSTGIPQIFWEFTYSAEEVRSSNVVYPIFKNLALFVEKSVELLLDQQVAATLSNFQFNDVIQNRDMRKNIFILENLFKAIASENNSKQSDANDVKSNLQIV